MRYFKKGPSFEPYVLLVLLGTTLLLAFFGLMNFLPIHRQLNKSENISAPTTTQSAFFLPLTHLPASPSSKILAAKTIKVPIITYHYLSRNPNPADKARNFLSVAPDNFESQLRWLRDNGYQTISLDTLAAFIRGQANIPAKPIILTFDDGYLDFYQNAYPLLRKYQAQATAFLVVNFIGQPGYLTWPQIEEIKDNGLIVFGSHTLSHPRLPRLPLEKALFEISESKKILESRLGYPVNFFAYPYGDFDSRIVEDLKKVGYIGAVTTMTGNGQPISNLYYLHRVGVSGNLSINDFIRKITE